MAEVYIFRLELESEKINSCSQLLNLEKIFFFWLAYRCDLEKELRSVTINLEEQVN